MRLSVQTFYNFLSICIIYISCIYETVSVVILQYYPFSNIWEAKEDVIDIYVREGISTDSLIDLQVKEIQKDVVSDEARHIGDAIYFHLRCFLDKLGTEYPSCTVSELLKVGSFHEGTKIHFADEFDFIAVLPELSKPKVSTIECINKKEGKVNVFINGDHTDLAWTPSFDWKTADTQERQVDQIIQTVCTRLYNIVMSDRKPIMNISLFSPYCLEDAAEWMSLPSVNGIALSIRFSEARVPNMVWEFLYKYRRISVDLTFALRHDCVEACYEVENATVPEIGRAIVDFGSVLLVGHTDGFRLTFTETELEYVRNKLNNRHKDLYMYLKSFNYKYGEHDTLKFSGYLPFSSYMLKSICIYHDLRCSEDTTENEACLRDIVDIMKVSVTKGYLGPAETLNETTIGYLPSIFNKSKNLYREPYKPVDRLSALRRAMIHDIKTVHLSGRKWSSLDHMLQRINDILAASIKEVCDQRWSDSKYPMMLK